MFTGKLGFVIFALVSVLIVFSFLSKSDKQIAENNKKNQKDIYAIPQDSNEAVYDQDFEGGERRSKPVSK